MLVYSWSIIDIPDERRSSYIGSKDEIQNINQVLKCKTNGISSNNLV